MARYGLVVGVAKYKSSLSNLSKTESDAKAVNDLLKQSLEKQGWCVLPPIKPWFNPLMLLNQALVEQLYKLPTEIKKAYALSLEFRLKKVRKAE